MARKRKRPPEQRDGVDKPPRIATGLGELLQRQLARAQPSARKAAASPAGTSARPAPRSPSRADVSASGTQPDRERSAAPAPVTPPAPDARSMRLLNDAYAGATPLRATRQGRAAAASRAAEGGAPGVTDGRVGDAGADAEARARLDRLVGGGVHFSVERDEDGRYAGLRQGVARTVLRRLRGPGYNPEATLDLHGMYADEAERTVTRFVRERHRRGARYLLIIHGAGQHSEAGLPVLAPRTVEALTGGGAAPLVQAFATAHSRRGGLGALSVLLK